MRVSRGKASVSGDITVSEDLDFLTLFKLLRLSAPASGGALRKGNQDITNAEIADAADIALSKLVDDYLLPVRMTTRGDMVYRGDSNPERIPAGAEGKVLTMGANDPYWGASAAPTVVRKTANQTVNNSDTMQDDDHLVFTVGADEFWVFYVFIVIDGRQASDFKAQFSVPSGGSYGCLTNPIDATYEALQTGVMIWQFAANFANGALFIRGFYLGGGTAGSVRLQWAQNTAVEEDTILKTNSYIQAIKL